MRVLLVVILDVLLVPVTGRKQSQLLVLGLSLEFDNYVSGNSTLGLHNFGRNQ